MQPGPAAAMTQVMTTSDMTSATTTASSTSRTLRTTTTTTAQLFHPATAASATARPTIGVRRDKLRTDEALAISTGNRPAVASKHGASSSRRMRSDVHRSDAASMCGDHVTVITTALLVALASCL